MGGDDRPSSASVCMSGSDCEEGRKGEREQIRMHCVYLNAMQLKASRQGSADHLTNAIMLLASLQTGWEIEPRRLPTAAGG